MSGINFGNPLSGLLPGLGGSKPGLPGGPQPPGLNLPGGIDAPPGHGGLPPGQNGLPPGHDGLPNPGGNNGLPGGDPYSPQPGATGPGTPTGTPDAVAQPNAPLLNPDNPASRLLQGQSPNAANANNAYNNPFNANSPTQYPPPTLSERALANAPQLAYGGDRVAVNYGVMPAAGNAQGAVVQGQGLPQTASGALPPSVGNGAAAAGSAAAPGASTAAAPTLTLVNTATANAVPAPPMAAAMSQDALAAQQSLLARMTGQHAPAAGNTAANAAPPPSETSATLPAVGTNAANNDPRSLPLAGNDRAAQQRGGDAPNTVVYTGDGATRRAHRRGGKVDDATLTHWLWRFGRGGVHRPSREAEPELEAVRALQWLFWVLTVVAYVCLAMAVVLMLPSGSLISERASPGGSGFALFLGVAVAAGAWWLGRRINDRSH